MRSLEGWSEHIYLIQFRFERLKKLIQMVPEANFDSFKSFIFRAKYQLLIDISSNGYFFFKVLRFFHRLYLLAILSASIFGTVGPLLIQILILVRILFVIWMSSQLPISLDARPLLKSRLSKKKDHGNNCKVLHWRCNCSKCWLYWIDTTCRNYTFNTCGR